MQKSRLTLWSDLICSLAVMVLLLGILSPLDLEAGMRSFKKNSVAATSELYSINIASYPEPFDKADLPRDRALKKYRLYTIKVRSRGQDWRGLRIGFFSSEKNARKALRSLPKRYKGAWIVKASSSERRLAGSKVKVSGTAAPGKSNGLVGYISNFIKAHIPKNTVESTKVGLKGAKKRTQESKKILKSGKKISGSDKQVTVSNAPELYSINIASYPEPFDKADLPRDRALKKYSLYTIKVRSRGQDWRGLRIGFFSSEKAAKKALRSLPKRYKGAWIVKASKNELNLAGCKIKSIGEGGAVRVKVAGGEGGRKFDHYKTGFPLTGGHERVRCESCHGRGLFKGTPTKCTVCHSPGGRVAAPGKQSTHINTDAQCDQCHLTATWSSVRFDHGSVSGSCAACHNNRKVPGKPRSHIKSNGSCETCHSTNSWASARFDHSSISGRCSTCHNGRKATGKPPTHITSSNSCDACHSPGSWAGARFDHSSASGKCSKCHNGRKATGKPPTHITSSNSCDACHSPGSWRTIRFDHSSVSGSCSKCHNGRKATGKPPTHITSSNRCEACHSPGSWAGARFDHSSVSGSCSKCHNGRKATGKPANHITSSNSCDACHSPGSWAGARFDHSSASGSCYTCHNGRKATGKPANHITSSNSCDACHSPGSWAGARFDHSSASGSCSTCHNGRKATGKSSNHFVTSVQCYECHSTRSWVPTSRYSHKSGFYPGDHRSKVGCVDCHKSNNQSVTWRNAAYKPDCAGCHAAKYKARKHKKVSSPRIYYTVSELRNCAGSCHRYTDSSMTTRAKTRNSKHKVSRGGF